MLNIASGMSISISIIPRLFWSFAGSVFKHSNRLSCHKRNTFCLCLQDTPTLCKYQFLIWRPSNGAQEAVGMTWDLRSFADCSILHQLSREFSTKHVQYRHSNCHWALEPSARASADFRLKGPLTHTAPDGTGRIRRIHMAPAGSYDEKTFSDVKPKPKACFGSTGAGRTLKSGRAHFFW